MNTRRDSVRNADIRDERKHESSREKIEKARIMYFAPMKRVNGTRLSKSDDGE